MSWGGERNIIYKSGKSHPSRQFKNLEGKPERESPKITIYASSGLGRLQMELESDTG